MNDKLNPYTLPPAQEQELSALLFKQFGGQVPRPDTPLKVRQFVNGWLKTQYQARRLPRAYVDYVEIQGKRTQITFGTPR